MGNVGPLELVVVLIIALVIFGPKRVPELGRSVGEALRNFKSSLDGEDDDTETAADRVEPPQLSASGESQRPDEGEKVEAEPVIKGRG